ncbi:MAG: hypothetical protein JNK82_26685 [Myxococcaceae bacterium]|nr:hypothetical protein [Myxococcaceae bacterium]
MSLRLRAVTLTLALALATLGRPASAEELNAGRSARARGAVAISVGYTSACAVLKDRTVRCWGTNEFGQLGTGQLDITGMKPTDPASETIHQPAPVAGLNDAISVSVGRVLACALVSNGTVRCWGAGGTLGDGTLEDRPAPVTVLTSAGTPLWGAKALSVGAGHACAVVASGDVYCWGSSSERQLGDGTATDRLFAQRVTGTHRFTDVVAGDVHTCGLRSDGQVWCWGGNLKNQLGDFSGTSSGLPKRVPEIANARSLAAGATHTCATLASGTLECWGDTYAQSTGRDETCTAVTDSDGGVIGCRGVYGNQKKVADPRLTQVKSVSAGTNFSCALLAGGAVHCWGSNDLRAIDMGGPAPRHPNVVPLTDTIALASGGSSSCALDAKGDVRCWGANLSGELGDGTDAPRGPDTAYLVPLGKPVLGAKALSSGGAGFTCQVNANGDGANGRLKCWGLNASGQLGTGATSAPRLTPGYAAIFPGGEWPLTVDSGNAFSCSLTQRGRVLCWGNGTLGALGNGVLGVQTAPASVTGLGDVQQVATGGDHACAVLADGAVKCWGHNVFGQLGDGSTTQRNTPVPVFIEAGKPLDGAVQVALGAYHGCALKADGTLRCWGYNGYGALGTGNTTNTVYASATPVLAGRAVAVSAGWYHTAVLLDDGRVQTFGYNGFGELGDNTTTTRLSPVLTTDSGCAHAVTVTGAALVSGCNQVATAVCAADAYCCATSWDATCVSETASLGVGRAVALSATGGHSTCAILGNGALTCWGANDLGQLGDGSSVNRATPFRATPAVGVSQVSTERAHVCAARSGAPQLGCWGANAQGQVGDGTTTPRSTPVWVTSF